MDDESSTLSCLFCLFIVYGWEVSSNAFKTQAVVMFLITAKLFALGSLYFCPA